MTKFNVNIRREDNNSDSNKYFNKKSINTSNDKKTTGFIGDSKNVNIEGKDFGKELKEIFQSKVNESKNNKQKIFSKKQVHISTLGKIVEKVIGKFSFVKKFGSTKIIKKISKGITNKKVIIALSFIILSPIVISGINNLYIKATDAFYVFEIKQTYSKLNDNKAELNSKIVVFNSKINEIQAQLDKVREEKELEVNYHDNISKELYTQIEEMKNKLNNQLSNLENKN